MKKGRKVLIYLIISILFTIGIVLITIPMLKDYNFGLDLKGGFEVLYEVQSMDGKKVTNSMVTSTYKTLSKRIDALGVSEPVIMVEGDNRIRVQLAGVTDKAAARKILSSAASLTFRDTSDNLLMSADVLRAGGAKIGQDNYGNPAVSLAVKDKDTFYEVTKKVSKMDDNRIVIWLDFEEGVNSFSAEAATCGSLSSSNCLSAATVSQGFSSDVIIQGNFEQEEVENLVDLINSGSLPTKLKEISSKTVAASFGEDSLNKTFIAGVVGIILIMLFMMIIYRFAGVISSLSVMIYTFATLFIFWLVGGVLTLPGIAAMVIGIGMAVDAIVISYSRIKEEVFKGNKLDVAIKEANSISLKSIVDANVTTLIAAFILFMFGESSVKGFATMLIISTLVSMFVMVFVSRAILNVFVKTGYFDQKLGLFIGIRQNQIKSKENPNPKSLKPFAKLDFVQMRKKIYLIFVLFFIIGCISLLTNKFNLGVDFKGGTSITIQTEQKVTKKNLREDLKELKLTEQSIDVADDTIYVKVDEVLEEDEVSTAEAYFKDKYEAQTDIGVVSNLVKKELVKNAILSLLLATLGIVIYISIRFKFNYAITAILALVHDVFLIVAVFSLLKLEVQSIFIAAILSIVGYSVNDTIVTFDRIRENKSKAKIKKEEDLKEVINNSVRETLGRSVITTITTLIPVICLIFLGSKEIFNFNFALLVGLVAGVYSSIFLASPLYFDFEKKNIGKPPKKKWYEE